MFYTKAIKTSLLATLFTATISSTSAFAAPIINDFGLSSPDALVTFSELSFPNQTIITNQFSGFGVTLTPGHKYNSQGNADGFPGIDGDYVGVSQGIPFQIIFGEIVSSAAFGYAKNPTNVLIEALLGNVVVESFNQDVHYNVAATSFLGFEGILFDRIQVTANVDEGLIDNIQWVSAANVPEPSSLLLLGLGFSVLGFARKKQI